METNIIGKIKHQEKLIKASLFDLNKTNDVSLFSGSTGLSLYQINRKLISKHKQDIPDLVKKYFDDTFFILQNNSALYNTYNLGMGYSGIIWYYSYLTKLDIIEPGCLDAMENQFINLSLNDLESGDYDYLHSSLGYTLAILDRCHYDKIKLDYFSKIINLLDLNKKAVGTSFTWLHKPNYEDSKSLKSKTINLGLSHGVPSIISILCKLLKTNVENKKVTELLESAVDFLLTSKLKKSNLLSLYPVNCDENGLVMDGYSRLGWCYGDVGVAVAFWQAGKALNRTDLKNESIEILMHASTRKNLKKNAVNDACICHGTSGIAHIFNRFFKETGIKEFDNSRWYWLNETLKMAKYSDGLAGFKTWEERSWKNDSSLLEGITGIGLVLLGFLTDDVEDLNWDSCILLS
jgi:hypothetical protein